jgi:succinyl-CoA synthetase beta subunit
VHAILINIFGGITRGDEVAHGLLEAFNTIKLEVPLVVRLVGTNQKEGREILAEAGITTVNTMNEAAERVVAAAKQAA